MTRFDAFHLPGLEGAGDVGVQEVELDGIALRHPRLTPSSVARVAVGLKEARRAELAERPVREIADAIARASALLEEDADLRDATEHALPPASRLSAAGARRVVDRMRLDWTGNALERLLRVELDGGDVLDRFVDDPAADRRVRAVGPELTSLLLAGNVPGVGVTAIIRCLLVKSGVFAKLGAEDPVLPVVFARALARVDAALGRCVAVAYWPGAADESAGLNEALLRAGDCVVVYGADDAVRAARRHATPHARVVVHGPKASCALIGRAALDTSTLRLTADRAALAVALFDQHGCVSPHVLYVEAGGEHSPRDFAGTLAEALGRLEWSMPRGPLAPGEAAVVRELRTTVELRAAADPQASALFTPPDLAFTVIFEQDPRFEASCLNRTIRIKPVEDLHDVLPHLHPVAHLLQSIGLAGVADAQQIPLAEALARVGATRISDLKDLPWPDPASHHDGGGPLRELLRFVDLSPAASDVAEPRDAATRAGRR